MSNKRKLWQIFGPVICAFILLGLVFLIPWRSNVSSDTLFKASVSQSQNVFKGQKIKQAAFSDKYVPFYGSSELSRMDPMHPSVLAYKYKRSYQPFLLGGPGSQSLTHFFTMQETVNQLSNKKAVFIISPQWFTKAGQDKNAFAMYFSQLQAVDWILSAKNSEATRYAARRLLTMPSGTSSESIKSALDKLANGQKLSDNEILWLKTRRRILINEDNLFSSLQLNNNVPRIQKAADKLPGTYAYDNLRQLANQEGAKATNNNPFGINNSFYNKRLKGKEVSRLKNSQVNFDYTKSPEYGDFELVLDQFAREHTNVLFIIPPVNEKWAKYTGLSKEMYETSVRKIKQQLISQGFNNIADLSRDGGKKYFMQDTIHLGWNGWLTVDQYVQQFMKLPNQSVSYKLNDYYFSKEWANTTKVESNASLNAEQKANTQLKKVLATNNVQGSVLVAYGNKKILQYANGWANSNQPNTPNTSYMINSVQKAFTGVLFMREVQAGKIKFTDKLSKFYPEAPHADEIDMRQLLQMTSGLIFDPKQKLGEVPYKNDQSGIKADFKHVTFEKKYYNNRVYSPINYVLIAGILEKLTHESYEELFTRTFIDKLNLKETAFYWAGTKKLSKINFSTGYNFKKVGSKNVLAPADLDLNEIHGELGTGSVIMSNEDLYRSLKAMLDGTLITKKSRNELFVGSDPSKAESSYGGGFYNLPGFHSTNGSAYGYTTYVRISNDGKKALIIQSNHALNNYFGLRAELNQFFQEKMLKK